MAGQRSTVLRDQAPSARGPKSSAATAPWREPRSSPVVGLPVDPAALLRLQRATGNRATVTLLKASSEATAAGHIQRLVSSEQFRKQTKLAAIKGKGKSKAEFEEFVTRLRRYEQMAGAPPQSRRQHLVDLRVLLDQWLTGKGKTSSRRKAVKSLVLEISSAVAGLDQTIHPGPGPQAAPHHYDDDGSLVDTPQHYDDDGSLVDTPQHYDDDGDVAHAPHLYDDEADLVATPTPPSGFAAIPVPTGPAAGKYAKTKSRNEAYESEFISGLGSLPEYVGKPQWVALDALVKGMDPADALALSIKHYSWGEDEAQNYRGWINHWSKFLQLAVGAKANKISQPQLVKMVMELGWTAEECDKYFSPGTSPLAAQMRKNFGWSQDDCDKYLPKVANMSDPNNPDRPLVTALKSEEERAQFQLHVSGTVTQGDVTEPYDTGDLFSKFMKQGWAIFVMDPNGRFFAAQHKVGLFHHSSFLAGGNVAGAGEIKVDHGKVRGITNKSGHYTPTEAEMTQVFTELEANGVNLASVDYYHLGPDGSLFADLPKLNAKKFYEEQKQGGASTT